MMRDPSGEWWIALLSRFVMTHAIFSLSTNSFEIFSGYSTSTKQPKRSASTRVAPTAYSISSIGLVTFGISCSFPVSSWVMLSSSPVIFSNRSELSRMLCERAFCSSFSAPRRLSSSSCRLIRIDDMGVFISCETVEMKFVLAESSSLYLVMLLRMITFPMKFCSFSPIGLM